LEIALDTAKELLERIGFSILSLTANLDTGKMSYEFTKKVGMIKMGTMPIVNQVYINAEMKRKDGYWVLYLKQIEKGICEFPEELKNYIMSLPQGVPDDT
jgi:hypothetical protein